MATGLAIVAGSGLLPRLLAEHCRAQGRDCVLVRFAGTVLDWADGYRVIDAEFEKPGRLFRDMRDAGCGEVCFAGGMRRPGLQVLKLDLKGLKLVGRMLAALASGDDAALRTISNQFEAEGFRVVAAHQILTGLLATKGALSKARPGRGELRDIERAGEIARALGQADVGQGVVVAGGICLGLESIQGTDAMLDFVARTGAGLRRKGGVLFKAPKPGQDWRTDLPVIGAETLLAAHRAGLNGIAVEAGGVMILQLETVRAEADRLGLFVWGV